MTNVGFEVAREDDTPYAWHKFGGEMAVSNSVVATGALGLALRSTSTSTKWAYQNVTVESSAFYEVSVWAINNDPNIAETLIRVSWYATDDASGEALSSADSAPMSGKSDEFHFLTTGAIQAHPDAHSARLRLLVRPVNSTASSAYFDDAAFTRVSAPAHAPAAVAGAIAPPRVPGSVTNPASNATGESVAGTASVFFPRTNIKLANVRSASQMQDPVSAPTSDSPGLLSDFLLGSSIVLPLLGMAALFSLDLSRASPRRE